MATSAEMMRVKSWLLGFDQALQMGDVDAVVQMFQEDECFWRDLVAFTWNIDTAESRDEIRAMLNATLHETRPRTWDVDGDVEIHPGSNLVQCFVTFETQSGRGKGFLQLKGDKCWCLLTTLQELKGYEEETGPTREVGAVHGAIKGRKTWLERKKEEMQELGRSKQPYCLIVGGGQGGIALGARLRRLGVPTIIIEKNKRAGDSWRHRYKSLCVHTPVWYDHMPYIPYPEHWPMFASKDKIGDWLEAYTLAMELVYWVSTECKAAQFDEAKQRWEVKVVRNESEEIMLYPTQLVLATGMSGAPNIPSFPGAHDRFLGTQCHSSEFRGGDEWAGKKCVVVGSNNSAHDICAHLWECGAESVTMIQRSPTHIFPSASFVEVVAAIYVGKQSAAEGDLLLASGPYKLLPRYHKPVAERAAEEHEGMYKGLEKVGFMHTFGDDGSGMIPLYLRRGSGYYIDVGATKLVIEGEVKVKSGVEVKGMRERSVEMSDGSEVEADLVVYATGYANMNEWAARLISKEVADKVGPCWGLGSNTTKDPGPWQRELRNMWKPTPQPHLWFHGGGFHEARHYSLYLALQLKARMEHIPTPVFRLPPKAL
eukprot:c24350_g2_i1 orf=474-2264(-)